MDEDENPKAAGVGEDMSLTAVTALRALPSADLLASIIAANSSAFGGFYTLIIDYAGDGVQRKAANVIEFGGPVSVLIATTISNRRIEIIRYLDRRSIVR